MKKAFGLRATVGGLVAIWTAVIGCPQAFGQFGIDGTNYATLESALAVAVNGDVVEVSPGSYSISEVITVEGVGVSVVGTGATPEETVLTCQEGARVFFRDASGVRVENLSIVSSPDADAPTLSFFRCALPVVDATVVSASLAGGVTGSGVSFDDCTDVTVTDVSATGFGVNGISLNSVANASLSNLDVQENSIGGVGIYTTFTDATGIVFSGTFSYSPTSLPIYEQPSEGRSVEATVPPELFGCYVGLEDLEEPIDPDVANYRFYAPSFLEAAERIVDVEDPLVNPADNGEVPVEAFYIQQNEQIGDVLYVGRYMSADRAFAVAQAGGTIVLQGSSDDPADGQSNDPRTGELIEEAIGYEMTEDIPDLPLTVVPGLPNADPATGFMLGGKVLLSAPNCNGLPSNLNLDSRVAGEDGCKAPRLPTVSVVTNGDFSATVNFPVVEDDCPEAFNIQFKALSEAEFTTEQQVDGIVAEEGLASYTFTDLPDCEMEFRIQSVCAEGTLSEFSDPIFAEVYPVPVLDPVADITMPTACTLSADGALEFTLTQFDPEALFNLQLDGPNGTLVYRALSASVEGTLRINGLRRGEYTNVTVKDSTSGCLGATVAGPFLLEAALPIQLDLDGLETVADSCLLGLGSISGIGVTEGSSSNLLYEWRNVQDDLVSTSTEGTGLSGVAGGFYRLTVSDDAGCSTTSPPIEVPEVNCPPQVMPNQTVVRIGRSVVVNMNANNAELDGEALAIDLESGFIEAPAKGEAAILDDNRVEYTVPYDPARVGSDRLVVRVCDEAGACANDTLLIGVRPPVVAPTDSLALAQLATSSPQIPWQLDESVYLYEGVILDEGRVVSLDLSGLGLRELNVPAALALTGLDTLDISDNNLTFGFMEPLIGQVEEFTYSPQGLIDTEERRFLYEDPNETVVITLTVTGTQDEVQWLKDGAELPGETGFSLAIEGIDDSKAGIYTARVENPLVPGLVLERAPVSVELFLPVIAQDSVALVALYNGTGGPQWAEPWTLTDPVPTWRGVQVSDGKVTEVDLSANGLIGTLPDGLGGLDALRSLDVSDNELTGIVATSLLTLANVEALERVDLRENLFTFVDLTEVNGGNFDTLDLHPQKSFGVPVSRAKIINEAETFVAFANANDQTGAEQYQWRRDGIELADDGRVSGSATGSLTIEDLNVADAGDYTCVVTHPDFPGVSLERAAISLSVVSQLAEQDLAALNALYDELGGEDWAVDWPADQPPSTWEGVTTDEERVIAIELRNANLTGRLPAAFFDLPALRRLDLQGNRLSGALPAEIGGLTQLEYLDLDGNDLSGPVPQEIENLTGLRTLILSNNAFTSLPESLAGEGLTALEFLFLQNNQFGSLPEWVGELGELQALNASHNSIEAFDLDISGMTSLRSLDLSENRLAALTADFFLLSNLAALDLDDNRLERLPAGIGLGEGLQELSLRRNRLTFEDLEPLTARTDYILNYAPQTDFLPEVSRRVLIGESTTLEANVGGSSNLYQWQFGGEALEGETSPFYRIASMSTAQTGNYVAVVTNTQVPGLQLRTSVFAVRAVCPGQETVTIEADGDLEVCGNEPVFLTLSTDFVEEGAVYRWTVDGQPVGFSDQSQISAVQTGVYTLDVTDAEGCSAVSGELEITSIDAPEVAIAVDHAAVSVSSSVTGGSGDYSYQWYANGQAIAGQTEPTASVDLLGRYQLEVTDNVSGCLTLSEATQYLVIASLEDETMAERSVSLFPTPTDGRFTVSFGRTVRSTAWLRIYDASGRAVHESLFEGVDRAEVDLTGQPAGVYAVEVVFEEGGHALRRVVKGL